MKHNIRQRQLDPNTGLIVTKIVKVEGELGSGVLDKNGREIFEGDKVKADGESGHYVVDRSDFWIKELEEYCTDSIEVVGHEGD